MSSTVYSTGYILVSGELASGAVSAVELGPGTFPKTIALTGNFSWSGVSAGTSGVAIVSGAFTPTLTGKLMINAFASLQTTAGGPTLAGTANMGIVSGTGIAVSGLGTPGVTSVTVWGTVSGALSSTPFSQTIFISGLTLNAAQNFALIMAPAASGLMSGTGTLTIQELVD